MSRAPRDRTNKLLWAVGLVSSAIAITASYLYYTSDLGTLEQPAGRSRRKIIIASGDIDELLRVIPSDATDTNEVYITLLHQGGEGEIADQADQELERRCDYLLHHQKVQGLTHLIRHIMPAVVVLCPSVAQQANLSEIKDWVDRIICIGPGTTIGNCRFLPDSSQVYQDAITS